MDTNRCIETAERISDLLQIELQQGIEAQRMVSEPLYARDVLLVCDAFQGHELAALASAFRAAQTEKAPAAKRRAGTVRAPGPTVGRPAPGSGWRVSRFIRLLFGGAAPDTPRPGVGRTGGLRK
jgi:hypothetical protein